jgi:hypothetical protein
VQDASHARNALARASQQANAGNISKATEAKIDAAANKKLKGMPMEQSAADRESARQVEGSKAEEARDLRQMQRMSARKSRPSVI